MLKYTNNNKYYIGSKFSNDQKCEYIIIGMHENKTHYYIQYCDEYKYIDCLPISALKERQIKNPYYKCYFGVGCIGEILPNYKSRTFRVWKEMIRRCYDEKLRDKYPTYKNVIVCKEWLCYAYFKKWFDENYIENYELDKDKKQQGIKNKIYSPKTCCFISKSENVSLAAAKNIDHYEKRTYLKSYFKNVCKRKKWDYNDFEEIFSGEYYIQPNTGYKIKKYFYKLKKERN